ncbi:MAG: TlpA disulfide reductase family protein [Bryobacteraceae bacterium]
MTSNTNTNRWLDRAVLAMLLCSLSMNAAMAWKLRHKDMDEAVRRDEGRLQEGSLLPALDLRDARGATAHIAVSGRSKPTVVYAFAPQCGWCVRNNANFNALASALAGRAEVVAVSLSPEGVEEYVAKHGIRVPVYRSPSRATSEAYRFGATPGMVVVSADGHVAKQWLGAWMNDKQKEIEDYFGVKLPGVPVRD